MSEQDDVIDDTPNVTADSDTDTNDQGGDDSANDDHDLEWYKQQNKKLFERAKEAEGFKLVDGKWVKKPKPETKQPEATQSGTKPQSELSAKDIILLSKSNINEAEDIDEVLDFAKWKKISVSEALGNDTLKAILADKSEKRRTAEVTNTAGSRRVTTKISDETLLANAQQKGALPDSEDDMKRIVKARLGIK